LVENEIHKVMTGDMMTREIEFEIIGARQPINSFEFSRIDRTNLQLNEGLENSFDFRFPNRQFTRNVRGRKKRASSRSNMTWTTKSLMKQEIKIIFNKLKQIELRLNNLKHI